MKKFTLSENFKRNTTTTIASTALAVLIGVPAGALLVNKLSPVSAATNTPAVLATNTQPDTNACGVASGTGRTVAATQPTGTNTITELTRIVERSNGGGILNGTTVSVPVSGNHILSGINVNPNVTAPVTAPVNANAPVGVPADLSGLTGTVSATTGGLLNGLL